LDRGRVGREESLEHTLIHADNPRMALASKKLFAAKTRKASPAAVARKRAAKARAPRTAASSASRAADLAERQKVGKTLDLNAFLAYHKRNKASTAHWETPE
jgi:hypothetical protein